MYNVQMRILLCFLRKNLIFSRSHRERILVIMGGDPTGGVSVVIELTTKLTVNE